MKKAYLSMLCCPSCSSDLELISEAGNEPVESGELRCLKSSCSKAYPIRNFIPRFVNNGKYAESFGEQWKTFAKTQLDSSRIGESELRWDSEVGWNESDISGKTCIEFGSGAGRFVDIVSRRGAKLAIGIDITDAVDASQSNIGDRENVFFIQCDMFALPIKKESIDMGYSIGVMHHTPNPEGAFSNMVSVEKLDGEIAVGLYEISLYHRPNRNTLGVVTKDLLWALNIWRCELFRVFTTRVPDALFLAYCKYFVPILHFINKIPILRYIRYLFPSTCYRHLPVEWSMLDTNDTYATKIVHQYRHKDVFQWFMKNNLYDMILHNGRAGWVSITAHKSRGTEISYDRYLKKAPPGVGEGAIASS